MTVGMASSPVFLPRLEVVERLIGLQPAMLITRANWMAQWR
jgi:hypothetical protein